MHLSRVIEQFGYKPKEAKIYLAALALGESTSSDIAKKVKLPRTSVQVILDKLHLDGVISFYVKRRYKYWVAENPERFLVNLKEKENILRSAMPEMLELRRNYDGKPAVKVFSGIDEIRLIFEDIIETKQPINAFIPWDKWIEMLGKEFMDDFIESRTKHFLPIRLLLPQSDTAHDLRERDNKELRHTRFLPERIDIKDTIMIYGSKVSIISLNKRLPTGITIDDPDTAKTMQVFFEETWIQSV